MRLRDGTGETNFVIFSRVRSQSKRWNMDVGVSAGDFLSDVEI